MLHPAFRLARRALLAALTLAGVAALPATPAFAQNPEAPVADADSIVTLSPEERAPYVGEYEVETPEGAMVIRIYDDGERLMALPGDDSEPSPLLALGGHRFRPALQRGALIVFSMEGDRALNFSIDFPDERGTVIAFRRP